MKSLSPLHENILEALLVVKLLLLWGHRSDSKLLSSTNLFETQRCFLLCCLSHLLACPLPLQDGFLLVLVASLSENVTAGYLVQLASRFKAVLGL